MRGEFRARGQAAMGRSIAVLALALFVVLGSAAPALGASRSIANRYGVVIHQVHSGPHPRAFWTPERIRRAEPLSVLGVTKSGKVVEDGGASPAAVDPSADGTDTGDPTLYPNSANGVVLFKFGSGTFRCSGSVIDSSAGNLVLTAGHCVINAGPGTHATNIVFLPGYRDGVHTFGDWPATTFATTPEWENTSHTGDDQDADEAGDIAMLTLANRPSDSATVQSVVGAVGIGFNQSRFQTYMEYGYPAQFPYDGTRLYELTAPWAVDDPAFSPKTMGISSDFTGGSSGGPWLVGSPPVAMSVSDYRYVGGPMTGYMFGPYFGTIAERLYTTVTSGATSPATSAGPASPPSNIFTIKLLRRYRHRGLALLGVKVPGAGTAALSGDGLRTVTRTPDKGRTLRMLVHAKSSALDELRDEGRLRVRVRIAFTPSGGGVNTKSRALTLIRRP